MSQPQSISYDLKDYNNKQVCILGFGREGQSTLRALQSRAPKATVTIADQNTDIIAPTGTSSQLGGSYLDNLDRFDVIIKSPGIRPNDSLHAVASKTITATQIFFASATLFDATIIGVTGSKGKSTTSALIYAALKAGDLDVELVGNIGRPMLDYLDDLHDSQLFVAELSSYQLHDLQASPHIAVVTSFFAEHLTYHGTLANYFEAKKHIAMFQTGGDYIFYNAASKECAQIAGASAGHKIGFEPKDFPLDISQTRLLGQHNLSNLAAAYKVAMHCGVDSQVVLDSLRSFEGLPHRLQALGTHGGIKWIDDSFSTAPDATLAALRALNGQVTTLIVGGIDRGYDFKELGEYLAASDVQNVILFPDTGAKIRQAIESSNPTQPKNYYEAAAMPAAVDFARANTTPGTTCLLSSGAPSFNLFKNFEDRGQQFADAARDI